MAIKVTVRDNGPLLVEGELEVVDATGKVFGLAGRTVVALCRCGLSATKPFCDGAHKREGFQNSCPAFDLAPPAPKV